MRTETTVRPSRGGEPPRAASDHIITSELRGALRRAASIALTVVLTAGLMPATALAWATEEVRGGGGAF